MLVGLQPVHEIATIRPSHSSHACRVYIIQLSKCIGDLHHVLIRSTSKVATDGTAEGLSTTSRAMRVRIGYNIASTRIYLPVTKEVILPLCLRSTMNINNQRIFLASFKAMRHHNKQKKKKNA